MELYRSRSGVFSPWPAACLLIGALVCTAPSARADGGAARAQHNKETVGKAFAAWTKGGQRFFDDVLAPDIVWTIKGSGPSAAVLRGRDDFIERGVKPLTSRLASPIRPTVHHIWADGEHVIVHWDGETTTRQGKPYRNSYVWILRMREGRATEVTAFLDLVAYDEVVRTH